MIRPFDCPASNTTCDNPLCTETYCMAEDKSVYPTEDELITERVKKLKKRYDALLHAMQTGVEMTMRLPDFKKPVEIKHLRVGINSALIDSSAITRLLIKRGLFTYEEYYEMLIVVLEEEVKLYEAELSRKYDKPVTLA